MSDLRASAILHLPGDPSSGNRTHRTTTTGCQLHGRSPSRAHGYIDVARVGPDLVSGVTLPAIEQVDLYNLMAALLRIEPSPDDGDPARMRGLLR